MFKRRQSKIELFDDCHGLALDLGCAGGPLLPRLLERFDRVVGLEYSFDAVSEAGRAAKIAEASARLGLVCGDAQRIPFPDKTFDGVLMSEVIEHVPDDAAALQEVKRVLKPSGCLVLTTPHSGLFGFLDPMNFRHRLPLVYHLLRFDRLTDNAAPQWHRHYSRAELVNLLAGFVIEEVHIGGLLLMPLMVLCSSVCKKLLPGRFGVRLAAGLWSVAEADAQFNCGRWGYNIWLRARRE